MIKKVKKKKKKKKQTKKKKKKKKTTKKKKKKKKKNPYLNPFVISLKINHIVHGFWWSSPTKANIVHNSRSFYLKGEGKKLF